MSQLRISIVQSDICWEDRDASLIHFRKKLNKLKGKTDLVVFPETFTTGFSMNTPSLADTMNGQTIETLKVWAKDLDSALAGSFIAREYDRFFNRSFFITPTGKCHTFDKRHLFRMGDEPKHYTSGSSRGIVSYKGWSIRILVCYDLRFPVWSRNVDNAYDLLIYVANWPDVRIGVWKSLLPARAIENMAFVCGVNRVGTDGNGLIYSGHSAIYSPKGIRLLHAPTHKETVRTCIIDKTESDRLREKFPVWKDADEFTLS